MRQADLSLAEVWIGYFAIGGSLSELEIDAYLGGQAELPALEGELLAEAVRSVTDDAPGTLGDTASGGRPAPGPRP